MKRIEAVLFGEITTEDVLARRREFALERDEFVMHLGNVRAGRAARRLDA